MKAISCRIDASLRRERLFTITSRAEAFAALRELNCGQLRRLADLLFLHEWHHGGCC